MLYEWGGDVMLTFAIEPISSIWDEKVACARNHWSETSMGKSGEVLNPLLSRYEQYEKLGWYKEFVARHDGEFAGFCGMYLVPSMHTQEMLATEDIIYIKPEYRNGRNGLRFYQYIEDEMRRLGASKVMLTAPPDSVANRILIRMGCQHSANQYSKRLE